MRTIHRFGAIGAAVALAIALPAGAHAQVGALGAAAALGVSDENAHVGAPVLTEHARVLEQGRFSFSAVGAWTTGDIAGVNFDVYQLLLSVFAAPIDNLTVGVINRTLTSVSVDVAGVDSQSGFGDTELYAKYQFAESSDGATSGAIIGAVDLPTAEEGFGLEKVAFGAGLAVSRVLGNGSLHGAATVGIPTDEVDGDVTLNLSAAGVVGLGGRIGVSAEVLASISSETVLNGGPALRLRASDNVFIDAGAFFNIASSFDERLFDFGLVAALNIGG